MYTYTYVHVHTCMQRISTCVHANCGTTGIWLEFRKYLHNNASFSGLPPSVFGMGEGLQVREDMYMNMCNKHLYVYTCTCRVSDINDRTPYILQNQARNYISTSK